MRSPTSSTEKLTALAEYVAARDAQQWSHEETIEAGGPYYDYSEGFLVIWDRKTCAFTVRRLPSHVRGIEAKEWAIPFPLNHSRVLDIVSCPSQDVLLVVTSDSE